MIKKLLKPLVLGATLLLAPFGAHALPIGLALVLDESGSISAGNFAIQTSGYVNALNNVLPTDGSVAVGVYSFSSPGDEETIFSMRLIDSAADLTDLTTAINNNTQSDNATCISCGITQAANDINTFGYGNLESAIIDVSTDGRWNRGVNPDGTASAWVATALGNGLLKANVNCLGIGASADCSFQSGTESFTVTASSFAAIQGALENKIRRELNIPEPASLALFGIGLFGIGAAARKSRRS